ncbi:hypothetical protein LTR56_020864 [Elasticomyces elasticus]|nr:hypothetical protein LTR56_020864 [Elasticomyces elasticus]KAK3652235.1 hypothetical protein LTR22_011736 [Elasticomyces elasticus]KAK4909928.1 hypothetical protein LTR49_021333 [Elasticomyces elasticus]KAK5751614.1 hypothetical protein LTS12_018319 [Elasticomyces elasticus]
MATIDMPMPLYGPLDASRREFRLVRLLHSAAGKVEMELKSFSLDSGLTYRALSYCWTKAEPSCTIELNKHNFLIRPSLDAYLQRIHALCINQDDVGERNVQVALMGGVYRLADTVVAWLGEVSMADHAHDLAEIQRFVNDPSDDKHLPDLNILEEHVRDQWQFALAMILPRPEYWDRLWIIQEILLARRLVVRYGDFIMDCDKLNEIFRSDGLDVGNEGLDQSFNLSDPSMRPGRAEPRDKFGYEGAWPRIRNMRGTLRPRGVPGIHSDHVHPLNKIMLNYSGRSCSCPHDKVFAVLALSVHCIKIDYDMPLSELYVRALVEGWEQSQLYYYLSKRDKIKQSAYTAARFFRASLPAAFGWQCSHPTIGLLSFEVTGWFPTAIEIARDSDLDTSDPKYWQEGKWIGPDGTEQFEEQLRSDWEEERELTMPTHDGQTWKPRECAQYARDLTIEVISSMANIEYAKKLIRTMLPEERLVREEDILLFIVTYLSEMASSYREAPLRSEGLRRPIPWWSLRAEWLYRWGCAIM